MLPVASAAPIGPPASANGKLNGALDHLNAAPPKLPKTITAGHLALRATLGYLNLRFEGKWERGRGKLKRWTARFDEKFPDVLAGCGERGV